MNMHENPGHTAPPPPEPPLAPADRFIPSSIELKMPPEPPTAWQSVPGFVRVAVWLWALVAVLGFAAGLVWSVIWVVILMVTLGSQ